MKSASILGVALMLSMMSCIRKGDVADKGSGTHVRTELEGIAEIHTRAGIKGGLIVRVGCGDAERTVALRINDSFLVQGLDQDPQRVAAAREHVDSLGLYGRITVDSYDGAHLPYTDNLINLLVVEDEAARISKEEMLRVLAPRGVALVGGEKIVKPVPPESGEWTHFMHGADNNPTSNDTKVGFPRHLQWEALPAWARHHSTVQGVEAMVITHGRVIYIVDESEGSVGETLPDQWKLIARDAFNGVMLWKKSVENLSWKMWTDNPKGGRFSFPRQLQRRLVAVGERIYVTLGFHAPVSVLDASTGEVLRTLEGTELCSEIVCHNGLLFLSMRKVQGEETGYYVQAIHPETGEIVWKSGGYKGFPDIYPGLANLSLLAGGNYVFFLDEKATVCLDAETGKERWRSDASHVRDSQLFKEGFEKWAEAKTLLDNQSRLQSGKIPREEGGESGDAPKKVDPERQAKKAAKAKKKEKKKYSFSKGAFPGLMYHDGIVLLLNPHAAPNLSAVSVESGETLWQKHEGIVVYGTVSQLSVAQDRVWVWGDRATLKALDLKTGEEVKRYSLLDAHEATVGHIRCYPEKGTQNTLWTTVAGKAQQFIDLDTGKVFSMPWLRAGCRIGVFPCNGFLYMTPHPCVCYSEIKLKGLLALAGSRTQTEVSVAPQLTKGPSYGKTAPEETAAEGWPMYRHDAARSNSAGTSIGDSLQAGWQTELKGKLTQPVVSGGRVYVVSIDRHKICALEEETGELVWTYLAGGRIDSPPTCHGKKVLFGSADGCIYALSAQDGSLIWKYRVDSRRSSVVVRGQLESAWPVHGSVLVHQGKIIAVGGRTTYLDGGMTLCLLDPDTGEATGKIRVDTTGLERPVKKAPGFLSDILVAQEGSVYMRFQKLQLGDSGITPVNDGTDLLNGGSGKVSDAQKDATSFIAAGGMLHDGFFHRSGMMYGSSEGQILAFDKKGVYYLKLFPWWNANNGPQFVHGKDPIQLVCDGHDGERKWGVNISQVPQAILLAGDKIIIGGSSDQIDPKDPWKAYEGRGTSKLIFYSVKDGSACATFDLPSVPVHDGISAANGKLFLSLRDGTVQCWR